MKDQDHVRTSVLELLTGDPSRIIEENVRTVWLESRADARMVTVGIGGIEVEEVENKVVWSRHQG